MFWPTQFNTDGYVKSAPDLGEEASKLYDFKFDFLPTDHAALFGVPLIISEELCTQIYSGLYIMSYMI